MRETENIIFNYFRYIKTAKYFGVKNTDYVNKKHYTIIDISATLNNLNLDPQLQAVLVKYGNRLHAPKISNSSDKEYWNKAIEQIHIKFVKKGFIQCQ